MKITPLDVQQQEFKSRFRGFDPEEVGAFLRTVSEAMEDLVKENAALKEQLEATQGQLQGLRQKESALNDVLVSTQRISENLKQAAQREAELILKEAELKADDVLKKTQEEYGVLQREILALQRQRIMALEKFRALLQGFQKMIELEELDSDTVDPRNR
ncbi:MAG TPA: DivIVA domain-containing protein [Nitrospirales bacterium]|jgi:cell division initiation protein